MTDSKRTERIQQSIDRQAAGEPAAARSRLLAAAETVADDVLYRALENQLDRASSQKHLYYDILKKKYLGGARTLPGADTPMTVDDVPYRMFETDAAQAEALQKMVDQTQMELSERVGQLCKERQLNETDKDRVYFALAFSRPPRVFGHNPAVTHVHTVSAAERLIDALQAAEPGDAGYTAYKEKLADKRVIAALGMLKNDPHYLAIEAQAPIETEAFYQFERDMRSKYAPPIIENGRDVSPIVEVVELKQKLSPLELVEWKRHEQATEAAELLFRNRVAVLCGKAGLSEGEIYDVKQALLEQRDAIKREQRNKVGMAVPDASARYAGLLDEAKFERAHEALACQDTGHIRVPEVQDQRVPQSGRHA